jgi:nucleoside-diphosphate-sugar epimerase
MKVLITGGAGFVGRWFTIELLKNGHAVTVVDNLVEGGGGIDPYKNDWFAGDPTKFELFSWINDDCRSFFRSKDSSWDLVIHLAAVIGGRLTIELNPLAVTEDLEIDSLFWRWVARVKPGAVVHFSSSAAYPIQLQTSKTKHVLAESDLNLEDLQGIPDLTYGWAKLTSEYISRVVSSQSGVKVATYRPFSGYGEDQDLSYPFTSIAKRAVDLKSSGGTSFNIWGSGLQSRDFIHISDIVKIVFNTYHRVDSQNPLNLGTGIPTSFVSLAATALEILDLKAEIINEPNKPEGVFFRVANVSMMRKLNAEADVSVQTGMARAIKYWESKA